MYPLPQYRKVPQSLAPLILRYWMTLTSTRWTSVHSWILRDMTASGALNAATAPAKMGPLSCIGIIAAAKLSDGMAIGLCRTAREERR